MFVGLTLKCTGGYGHATRGLYRVHQFSKVELFAWTPNETTQESEDMLKEMVAIQKEIAEELGLHYRFDQYISFSAHSVA